MNNPGLGETARDRSGSSVSGAGDVNGDGLADLLVGAPFADPGGASYVVFGRNTTDAVELSAVAAGIGGFAIRGPGGQGGLAGSSVSGSGDVNGDGLSDLVVGVRLEGPGGATYVVFGKSRTEAVQLVEVATGTGGFVIRGADCGADSGQSVSGAGDVNGDGLSDILVGDRWASCGGKEFSGATYVVFGKSTTEAVELSVVAEGIGGFVIHGENSRDVAGWSVSCAGDLNRDGLSDLVIGAPSARKSAGATYVVFGRITAEAVELSDVAAGKGGFVILGESEGDASGSSVSGTGDFNGDGIPDLATVSTMPTSHEGTAYVVFEHREGFGRFLRGDCNDNGDVDISDAVCVLNWLFRGSEAPACIAALNTNGDDGVNVSDPVYSLSFSFLRGPAPVAPFPECGPGTLPADEEIGCETPPKTCQE